MKKKFSLLMVAFMAIAAFAVVGKRAQSTITWDFSEFTEQVTLADDNYEVEYNGLTLVGNPTEGYAKDYVSASGRFHMNGASSANQRYIKYTPEYSGKMTVTYRSNSKDVTDRITAIGTEVANFTVTNIEEGSVPESVLAYGQTEGTTDKTISAELTAGTTYYIYLAAGGQTIRSLEYVYDVDTWTVAGSNETLFGTAWDTSNTSNDMTKNDEGLFVWSKKGVTLEAGDVQFKVVKNYSWDIAYPSSNYQLPISEAGRYNVTITFNPSTYEVNATAEKDTRVETTTTWDFSEYEETVSLVDATNKVAVQLSYNGLTLVGNNSGTGDYVSASAGFHGNGTSSLTRRYIKYTPENDGTMTVTYRSNKNDEDGVLVTDRITAIGTSVETFTIANIDEQTVPATVLAYGVTEGSTDKTFDAALRAGTTYYIYFANGGQSITKLEYVYLAEPAEAVYGLVGAYYYGEESLDIFGCMWDETKAAELTKGEDGVYTWTKEGVELQPGSLQYKVVKNNSWNENWGMDGESGNATYGIGEAGTYDIVIKFNPNEKFENGWNIDATFTKEEAAQGIIPDGTYYVMSANEGTLINSENALDAKGTPITFTFDADANAYTISGADFFANKQWTIADAVEGMSGFYTISNADGFLAVSATSGLEQIEDGTAEAAVWIFLQQAYWEDIVNSTYTVAGTKNLTGTENDWEVAEANQMTLNEQTGLFEKKFRRIAVNAESQPEFKVVKKDMEGNETWYPDNNWVITTDYVGGEGLYDITITFDPSDLKEIGVIAEPRIVFPEDAIVFDFEAAAAAGENPANKNGSADNGQAFYAWEKADKTDSKRQDYKGYEWAEGSVLPEVCQVWRRSDRINGNVKDYGLYCPNNREMAVDGLEVGDKVVIVYDAENATDKEIIWAIGDGSSAATEENPAVARATATIDGVELVIGESTIASGAEILVNSVTPADNGTGYIVFQVKKGMYIQQIAIIKAVEEPVYTLVGSFEQWDDQNNKTEVAVEGLFDRMWDTSATTEWTYNEESGTYTVTFSDIELPGKGNILYKVVKNHAYENGDWGTNDGGNCYYWVNEAGKYTITFTFDPNATGSDWFVTCEATKTGEATGINAVKAETLKNAEIFNLAGQRVQNAQKGLYIVNGKKVVIK